MTSVTSCPLSGNGPLQYYEIFLCLCKVGVSILLDMAVNLCGGGVEYLHREPASHKRRRNGTKKGHAVA
jgi:hypothetical protein